MSTTKSPASDLTPLLTAMLNMTAFHREHEKFYSVVTARTGRRPPTSFPDIARARRPVDDDRTIDHASVQSIRRCADLNAAAALQLDGVLFMEGEGEPGEIRHLERDLRTFGRRRGRRGRVARHRDAVVMGLAAVLLDIDELADMLGERHRIIANNWQGASMMSLAARILERAADAARPCRLHAPPPCAPTSPTQHASARRLYSAAEMIDHAADLFSEFAGIVHDNERRWRVFRARVQEYAATLDHQS